MSRPVPFRLGRRGAAAVAVVVLAAGVLYPSAPATAQHGSVPARPTGLSAAAAHDSVKLSWDDPGDADISGYEILRRDRALDAVGVFHTIEDDTATAAAAYTDATVAVGGSYVYRVKALNAHGAGPRSSYARADVPRAPTIEVVEPPEPEPEPELTAEPQNQVVPAGQIWSATLTVNVDGNARGYHTGGGGLDPTEFSYGGVDYELEQFFYSSPTFWMFPEPLLPSHATSRLSVTLAGTSHSSLTQQATFYRLAIADPGWMEDQEVAVSLALSNAAAIGQPVISSPVQLGQTLTVDTTAITDNDGIADDAEFACQWQRDASDIPGATACTYTPLDSDVGMSLQVKVTFTDNLRYSETVTSEPVEVPRAPNNEATGKPTISGTRQQGQRLIAGTDDIVDADGIPDDADFACQWQRIDGDGANDISGATDCTYVPVEADAGKALQVQVTFTDSNGNAETVTSDPTDAVVASPYTEVVWSATLTPGNLGSSTTGFNSSNGTLSPNTFTLDEVMYAVSQLSEVFSTNASTSTSLIMELSLDDFALQIGTRQFLSEDLDFSSSIGGGTIWYSWTSDVVQLLKVGTPVAVTLLTKMPDLGAPAVTISGETSAAAGKTITLTAVATDPDGDDNDLTYAWSTDSRNIPWQSPATSDSGKTAVYTVPSNAQQFLRFLLTGPRRLSPSPTATAKPPLPARPSV